MVTRVLLILLRLIYLFPFSSQRSLTYLGLRHTFYSHLGGKVYKTADDCTNTPTVNHFLTQRSIIRATRNDAHYCFSSFICLRCRYMLGCTFILNIFVLHASFLIYINTFYQFWWGDTLHCMPVMTVCQENLFMFY